MILIKVLSPLSVVVNKWMVSSTVQEFRQQVFIMFHGTDLDSASFIAREQHLSTNANPPVESF